MILGFEDDANASRGFGVCKARGAYDLGHGIANDWLRDRYATPYLRDVLMDRGVLVDTLETATTWENLERLHEQIEATIRDAAAAMGSKALVMTHVSHGYRDGASLYVTFLARMAQNKIEQWEAIKRAATDCIMTAERGGTLSHHHGVGYEHAAWLQNENGATGMDALQAIKNALDPSNVMNPGKWLDAQAEQTTVDLALESQERFWNLPNK